MYPLFKTIYNPEFDKIFKNIFLSGEIASGDKVNQIEKLFSDKYSRDAISTNNSSNAIFLLLKSLNLSKNSLIGTSPFNCLASTSPISNAGHNPCWIDVNSKTGEMCPKDLEAKIKISDVRAVIYYHFSCQTDNIFEISKICKDNNIYLIEDCTVSLGAKIKNKLVGSFGDATIFSFYPNRQINAVDGGMLLSKDINLINECKSLRKYGIDLSTYYQKNGQINPNSNIKNIGWSMSLPNINAGLACQQFEGFMDKVSIHQRNAEMYFSELKDIDDLIIQENINLDACFWTFPVLSQKRDEIMKYLNNLGVMAGKVHQRNDIYSGFNATSINLNSTKQWCSQHLSLPVGWWLEQEDIKEIINIIKDFKW